jgi:hypothetical protein
VLNVTEQVHPAPVFTTHVQSGKEKHSEQDTHYEQRQQKRFNQLVGHEKLRFED